jgi:hypothetical protein
MNKWSIVKFTVIVGVFILFTFIFGSGYPACGM